MPAILAFVLKFILSKALIKKIAEPLIEELFQFLNAKAKDSASPIDDKLVEIFRNAVREFLKAW